MLIQLRLILAGLCLATFGGRIQAAELPAAIDAKQLFGQLDADGDGTLTSEEIPEEKKTLYQRLVRLGDGNADGKLSADEFAVGLAGGEKTTAAPADAGDAKQKPAKARPGRPGKAARPVPGRFLAELDANGDGKLSPDEVPEARRANFQKLVARLDQDGDGALSKSEMPAGGAAQPASLKRDPAMAAAAMFKRMDANADGKVTADEVPEERRELVTRMIRRGDKDGDGALSGDEFAAIAKQRAEAAKKTQATPTSQATTPEPQPVATAKKAAAKKNAKPGNVQAMPASLFRVVDKDRDGKLNSDEISGAPESIKSLDRNGDGTVTAREIARGENTKGTKKKPGGKKKKKTAEPTTE